MLQKKVLDHVSFFSGNTMCKDESEDRGDL